MGRETPRRPTPYGLRMVNGLPVGTEVDDRTPPLRSDAMSLLHAAAAVARHAGRDDIAERLDAQRSTISTRTLRVLVVGEFKQGKSTLINALVDAPVCPVDDDISTAAPIALRYGDVAAAQVRLTSNDGGTEVQSIAVEAIAEFATDMSTAPQERALAVDVQLPSELLRTGIELVDTPGIGGLGSAHGAITAAALPSADAVILTTDASQPLTRPEMELLAAAHKVCPTLVCVVTKIDLYPAWRKVVDLDVATLAGAGIPAQVMPVSALLATVPGRDQADESRMDALRSVLLDDVVGRAAASAAREAATDVAGVARQMLSTLQAEHAATTDQAASAGIAAALASARERAEALETASATWQTTLTAQLEQLAADAQHQLQGALRTLRREAEDALEEGDPAKIWEQYEAWLTRRAGVAVADAFVFVATRAKVAAGDVLRSFGDDEGAIVSTLELAVPEVSRPAIAAHEWRSVRPEGLVERGASLLRGAHSGVEVFSLLAGVVGLAVANPLVIGLGLLLGGQALRQERAARIAARRKSAAEIATRYLDDVAFAADKDVADAVRGVEHSLRQDLSSRARELSQSFTDAAAAAERTLTATAAQRAEREKILAGHISAWDGVWQSAVGVAQRAGDGAP